MHDVGRWEQRTRVEVERSGDWITDVAELESCAVPQWQVESRESE